MSEVFDDEWESCFWDLPDFRYAVWRVARDWPRLHEDMTQEAALAVVRERDRIAAAEKPVAMLRRVARFACIDLLRRECKVANPRYSLSLFRGRRAFSRYLYSLRSREPAPDFLAALREEYRAGPVPVPKRKPPGGPSLTPDQRAALRDILLEAENWSRHEVITEFRRRTGRTIGVRTAYVYCKALGITPPWADCHRDFPAAWARYKHSPGMRVV